MNPYEAPQTIEEALPVATAVDSFVRTREGLIRATALCIEGGRTQFAAGLLGILAVLLGLQRDEFLGVDETLGRLFFLICSIATCVLWTWGASKNYRGYTGLAEYVTNPRVQGYYTLNQIHWWVQFGAGLVLIFVVSGWRMDQEALAAAVGGLITLSYLHVILVQAMAFRYWATRLELPLTGRGYFVGGMAVVSLLALEWSLPLLGYHHLVALHIVLSFILAVTSWDFAQRYQTIQVELQERRD